jgi:hypothetical protein
MKSRICSKSLMVLAVMMLWGGPVLVAQNATPAPSSEVAPVQLSADVWDVLRLAHGKVGDPAIIAYIKNSGKVYSLGASEILYLREQGLSDEVVMAMLNQRRNVAANVPATAPQPILQAPPQPAPTVQPVAPAESSQQPQYAAAAQPQTTYVQAAPVYSQPAPVYVYPQTYPYYYSSWPYYGSYWGYPGISLSFGWGGYYGGHGGYYGGHYGGGYHGGGSHGGGYSGGGHGGGGHR